MQIVAAVSNDLALSRVAGRRGRSQTPSYLPNITQLLLKPRGATSVFNAVLNSIRLRRIGHPPQA
jgi:hypothetical protein